MRTNTFTFLFVVILTHGCLCYIHQFKFSRQNGITLISAFLTWACISAMDSNMQTRFVSFDGSRYGTHNMVTLAGHD